jgi:hypothetical protein
MNRLNLSPLPCARLSEETQSPSAEHQGFVDDAVVLALLTGPTESRPHENFETLALAADETDFAGWRLPFGQAAQTTQITARRPAPPEFEESIGEPRRNRHRWWLAGFAGAISTLLVSALLLPLSPSVTSSSGESFTIIRNSANSPQMMSNKPRIAPELTRISQDP